MVEVRIYTKTNCPFCDLAKSWFGANDIPFTQISLDDDIKRAEFYAEVNKNILLVEEHIRTIPQIFVGDIHIGGYDNLMARAGEVIARVKGSSLTTFSKTYKPFNYPWAVDLTVKHEKAHWIEDEIDLSEDVTDWKNGKITKVEKEYITNILRLFTQSDVAVGQNYYDQFIPLFKNNEIRNMLGSFAAREGIHQRAYALLNDTLGLPDSEYHAFLEYKAMTDKIDFMMDADPTMRRGLGLCLAKTVFNEGVALFASFAMLLNFQRFGKMKGMGKVVEWSIRDESMHVEGNAALFRIYCQENPYIVDNEFKKEIYLMASKAVELEDRFIELAYELGTIEGLKADEVKQYIRHITDRRLNQLGLKEIYNIEKNPLTWLEWILNGADHTNFFENRVTEYEVAGLTGSWDEAYSA
ncbi:ribonucleotide-diphosphate reductase subunit beta [Francisella tularensis]|uniref:ribonucleotide-diphosphate reductase subunit beta n=1 Tax=Francisella tularensis TaxID=263 RepID=UPI001C0F07C6|nr:ribonucleotide-diphosphate reductase subunit beta [Francisella tularensis]MBK2239455.1 ribonucleotide-diphosphate reductase subunit beta [Francisella tularensis]